MELFDLVGRILVSIINIVSFTSCIPFPVVPSGRRRRLRLHNPTSNWCHVSPPSTSLPAGVELCRASSRHTCSSEYVLKRQKWVLEDVCWVHNPCDCKLQPHQCGCRYVSSRLHVVYNMQSSDLFSSTCIQSEKQDFNTAMQPTHLRSRRKASFAACIDHSLLVEMAPPRAPNFFIGQWHRLYHSNFTPGRSSRSIVRQRCYNLSFCFSDILPLFVFSAHHRLT